MDIVSLAVGLPPRAKTNTFAVPLVAGLLGTVSAYGLLAPITYSKLGGSSNLTVSSTGGISATAALTAGEAQSINGLAAGSDGYVIPWNYTLVGLTPTATVPAAPTVTIASGDTQLFVGWTDNSDGGATITSHNVYVDGQLVSPVPSTQTSVILTNLANNTSYSVRVSAVNLVGESLKSDAQIGVPAAPTASPLTARGSILMPHLNGQTVAHRYEAPAITNWMQASSVLEPGFVMMDMYLPDFCVMLGTDTSNNTLAATSAIGGVGSGTTTGNFTLWYNSVNHATNPHSISLFTKTSDMASSVTVYSPRIRDTELAFTMFLVYSSTGVSVHLAYADGTIDKGTESALPGFKGRTTSGVFSIGGYTLTALSTSGFSRGMGFSRFGYVRSVPVDADLAAIAKGRSPAEVFPSTTALYYPMTGPTDLAATVGSGTLVLRTYGTDIGVYPRKGGTLSGAFNGTVGFNVKQVLLGSGWAVDIENIVAGAPVTLSITNTAGASTEFEARAVYTSDGSTVHAAWTTLTGGAVASGATATLTLPSVQWSPLVNIEVRRKDTPALTWMTNPVGVGPDIIDDGQSQQQIWGTNIATDSTVLAANTVTTPCVAIAYSANTAGPITPFIHQLIETPYRTPIGPTALAIRWAALTGGKWLRIRSTAVEGSGRNLYINNENVPQTTKIGPYKYWGTTGTKGTGIVADMLAMCGTRFSGIIGHYSVDDHSSGVDAWVGNPLQYMSAYINGTGSPLRSYAQISNPIGIKQWILNHDRIYRASGLVPSFYREEAAYRLASGARYGPGLTLDKMMGTSADQAHQHIDNLKGNARMGTNYAVWLAGICGVPSGRSDFGRLVGVTSASPYTSATCQFALPEGSNLITTDGLGQVFGFEISINGGAWIRWPYTQATISGNTVVLTGIAGVTSAGQIRVRHQYDHVWGTSTDAATRYAEDNLMIDKVLLASMSGAPSWAPGTPLDISAGEVVAVGLLVDQTPLAQPIYNVGYTQFRSITGGTGPYSVAVTDGTLPAGLEVCCSGSNLVVSGIPTAATAQNNLVLTVTDSVGTASTFTSVISVPDFPATLTVSFGNKTLARHGGHYLGNAIGTNLTITAGNSAGHWAIVDNRLVPAGTYGGTPPAYSGPYTLTVNNGASDCIVTVNIEQNVAHVAVGTTTNVDTASSFQLRTLMASTTLTKGTTIKLRNGSYNPSQLDCRLRPLASYTGTGRIIITSEWLDPYVDSYLRPRRGGGAKWSQLKFDSGVSGDVEFPFDLQGLSFYCNTSTGVTSMVYLCGYATLGWGVGSQYCRYEFGPNVATTSRSGGFHLVGCTTTTYDCSYNTFEGVQTGIVHSGRLTGVGGIATGCTITNNDMYNVYGDGIDFAANSVSGVICTDNLMPSWQYTAGAHQDGIQDQGSTTGAIVFGDLSRNIIYNANSGVIVQGLFNDDTTSGSSRDNAVIKNNIVISSAPNGIVLTRFNNPTVQRNTIIASLTSSSYDVVIRTAVGDSGTGGTFDSNVANLIQLTSQTGATTSNNKELARTLSAYQAAFSNWSESGTLLTRDAIKRIVTPIASGPLMNVDGTYAGALMPNGSWNTGT